MRKRNDDTYMSIALTAAEEAKLNGNLPIGSVLLFPNGSHIIENNTVHTERDYTNHAEMNVMRKASQTMFRRLKDSILYSTIEPCAMCASAAMQNGIKEIVFGGYDIQQGFTQTIAPKALNIAYRGGILVKECVDIFPERFKNRIVESVESGEFDALVAEMINRVNESKEANDIDEKRWLLRLCKQLNIGIYA